jgi:hypothetical protein
MSNVFITDVVGTIGIPGSDAQLASATSTFDGILSAVANLTYDRVLAWVEDQGGPDGAEGTRTLNCMVEKITYLTQECPSEAQIDTMTAAIEAALEADASITSIGEQQCHLFQAGAYFLWNRDVAGGFVYPNTTTDDIVVGGHVAPNGKWFDDGDLVLGDDSMDGTEVLRVVGTSLLEDGVTMNEAAAEPTATAAGEGSYWVKDDAPTTPYFTDDDSDDHQLAYLADTAPGAVLHWGNSLIQKTTTTRYLDPGYESMSAPTTEIRYTIPFACTLKNLYIYHNSVGAGAQTITYTVMKNGVGTALTVTMAPGSASGSDTVNTVSFAAGDEVSIEVTKSAVLDTAPQEIMASLEVAQ